MTAASARPASTSPRRVSVSHGVASSSLRGSSNVDQRRVGALVVDLHQARRRGGLVRRRCDDDGDVLAVVVDAVVLQGRRRSRAQQAERGACELRSRLVRDDGEDAWRRASVDVVDRDHSAAGDGAAHERDVRKIGVGDIGRVGRGAANLERAVDSVDTDDRSDVFMLPPSRASRTIVRFASSTLNAVPGTVNGSTIAASAAARNAALLGRAASSTSSAAAARHGIVPTPPSARRAWVTTPSSISERRGRRSERELIGGAVAHLQVAGPAPARKQRDLDRGDQLAVRENVLEVGSIARDDVELGQRDAPFAVRPWMCTTVSSATSGTQRSEACSAMQCSLAPRIACIRAGPLMAAHPDPGARLLHAGTARIAEVATARALQQVAADRRHVAKLRRGAGKQRLAHERRPLARPSGRLRAPPSWSEHRRRSTSPRRLIPRSGKPRDVDQSVGVQHAVLEHRSS